MKLMMDISPINRSSEPGLCTFYQRKRNEYVQRRSWKTKNPDSAPKYAERLVTAYADAFCNLGSNLTTLGLVVKLGTPAGAELLLDTVSVIETRLDQLSSDVEDLYRRVK